MSSENTFSNTLTVLNFYPGGQQSANNLQAQLSNMSNRIEQIPSIMECLKASYEAQVAYNNVWSSNEVAEARNSLNDYGATTLYRANSVSPNDCEIRLQQIQSVIDDVEADARYYGEEIRKCQQQLANLKGEVTYSRPQLDKELLSHPNIDCYETLGRSTIRVKLTDIKMKPSENPYEWLNNGNDIYIPLPDIWVKLELSENRTPLWQADVDDFDEQVPRMYDGRSVHPHIFNMREAEYSRDICLGDFGTPYTEALKTGDIGLIISILICFLEQANTGDCAGKHWPKLINPDLSPVRFSEEYYYDEEDDTEHATYEVEEQDASIFLQNMPSPELNAASEDWHFQYQGKVGPIIDDNNIVVGWGNMKEVSNLHIKHLHSSISALRHGISISSKESIEMIEAKIIPTEVLAWIRRVFTNRLTSSNRNSLQIRWESILKSLENGGFLLDLEDKERPLVPAEESASAPSAPPTLEPESKPEPKLEPGPLLWTSDPMPGSNFEPHLIIPPEAVAIRQIHDELVTREAALRSAAISTSIDIGTSEVTVDETGARVFTSIEEVLADA